MKRIISVILIGLVLSLNGCSSLQENIRNVKESLITEIQTDAEAAEAKNSEKIISVEENTTVKNNDSEKILSSREGLDKNNYTNNENKRTDNLLSEDKISKDEVPYDSNDKENMYGEENEYEKTPYIDTDDKKNKSETGENINSYKEVMQYAEEYNKNYHKSKKKLYDRLIEKHGFPENEAKYAVNNIQADWKENALKTAERYVKNSAFSKKELCGQLTSESEEFTQEEAVYAAENVKADWKNNALKKAEVYKNDFDFSNEKIYKVLISDYYKFTPEEAEYAVNNLQE